MSYLFRWVRQQQALTSRAASMLNGSTTATNVQAISHVKPLYQMPPFRAITSTRHLSSDAGNQTDSLNKNRDSQKFDGKGRKVHDDGIEYVISYKQGLKVKDVIKQVYSLYGPVFVACHILISLSSLGFFCGLVMLSVDLKAVIPSYLLRRAGESMLNLTEQGGKFVLAYAIHKVLLPFRLFASIGLTRFISRKIKARKSESK